MENSGKRGFREFVDAATSADLAHHVDRPVNFSELCNAIRDEEQGRNRPLLFDQFEGYSGRLAANVFGAPDRIYQSVGADSRAAFFEQIDRAAGNPRAILEKDGEFERLSRPALLNGTLPLIVHSEFDRTPYITSGVVLTRHPDTGRHHLCFVRLAVVGDDVLLFNGVTPRIKAIVARAMQAGQPLEVLILLGAPPQVLLSGALSLPDDIDELEFVQAWAGDRLSFVPHRLPVPNGTEIVLFGQVLPEFRDEGPFGDSFGTYSTRENPVCRISEVWQQKDPIYHVLLGGASREHIELLVLKAMHAMEHVRAGWKSLKSYAIPAFAGGRLCILTVDQHHEIDRHLSELFAVPLIRTFILVNRDVDPESGNDILWALTRRTAGAGSYRFQASSEGPASKVVIDAADVDLSDWNNRRI